jgi:CubicO group peptidase (beta-lactamase class C family)
MAFWPGRGFGLGITVLNDPVAAQTPESAGTWRMGGTYGHSWFVDPAKELTVVAFTNTALEGMSGAFVPELCEAVYGSAA